MTGPPYDLAARAALHLQYVSLSLLVGSHPTSDLLLLIPDLGRQLSEAKATTASLRAERLFVSQKPLNDSTCLR